MAAAVWFAWADYLSVPVIAEEVETEEQFTALRAMGCDLVQGYYFSRPVPAAEFQRFVEARRDMTVDLSDVRKESPRRGKKVRPEDVSFGRIAYALSSGFERIYYVDTENGHYVEFTASGKDEDLQIERSGTDFFGDIQRSIRRVVWPEDVERLTQSMQKESLLSQVMKAQPYSITCRLMIDGAPTYVHLKASRMEDKNDKHIVIGISDIDAQMRREQAQDRALRTAREMANRDALTGVKSKHAFVEAEEQWNARIARGEAGGMAIVFCDLNGLKAVNDTLGHKAGDQYIKDACMAICRAFQHSPVFRIGGDEFVAILSGADYEHRAGLMEAFTRDNARRAESGGAIIACGMAEFRPGEDKTFASVFDRADAVMYEDKKRLKAPR